MMFEAPNEQDTRRPATGSVSATRGPGKQGSSNVLLFALSFVATFALVWLLLEIF